MAPFSAWGKASRMVRRIQKQPTVLRLPVRFNQTQLDLASSLLANTGITNLTQLVHFALAQLAKTAVGAPHGGSQASLETRPAASHPDPDLNF